MVRTTDNSQMELLNWGQGEVVPCSATEVTLDPVTSATRIFLSLAALRSMWSDPIPDQHMMEPRNGAAPYRHQR
jgi:hypothetical protein